MLPCPPPTPCPAPLAVRAKYTPVPYTEFYNDAVNNEDFNLKEDFRRWKSVSLRRVCNQQRLQQAQQLNCALAQPCVPSSQPAVPLQASGQLVH